MPPSLRSVSSVYTQDLTYSSFDEPVHGAKWEGSPEREGLVRCIMELSEILKTEQPGSQLYKIMHQKIESLNEKFRLLEGGPDAFTSQLTKHNELNSNKKSLVKFDIENERVHGAKWEDSVENERLLNHINFTTDELKRLNPKNPSYPILKDRLQYLQTRYELLKNGPNQFAPQLKKSQKGQKYLRTKESISANVAQRSIHSPNQASCRPIPWNSSTRIVRPIN